MTTSQLTTKRVLEYQCHGGLLTAAWHRLLRKQQSQQRAAAQQRHPPRSRSAFTLIELLLVMVILAILASLIIPMFVGRAEQARVTAAQTDISNISSALDTFEIDNGHYPTTSEGLIALIKQPPGMPNWHGPYLKGNSVPLDPWGHPYQYRCPGQHSKDGYDLWSLGPTGQQGGPGEITNWGPSQ